MLLWLRHTHEHRIEVLTKGKAGVGTRTAAKNLRIQKKQERLDWVSKRSTIQRYLKRTEWGRQAYRLRTKPLLSEKNIQDRVQFCQTVDNNGYLDPKRRGVEKRAHILWTDESPIPLHPKPNAQNMQIRVAGRDEIPIIQLPKCSETVMIAGGICSRGKTPLIIIPKGVTITAKYYQENILPVYFEFIKNKDMFPNQRLVTFMQDGAPAHTAKSTLKCIRENMTNPDITLWSKSVWPGNSPDFNVIEHLWHRLQNSVFIEPRPSNRAELIDRITRTWEELEVPDFERLVESFPKRIQECKDTFGKHTSY